MPQSSAARVEQISDVAIWEQLPFNAQRDALRRVGERLLDLAADPSVGFSDRGRADARRVGAEMLDQASK
jgi:hypothetical protein